MADDNTYAQAQERADKKPVAELQPQFSSHGATTTAWAAARERLEKSEVYWLATVRPDSYASKYDQPFHFTVRDGAFYGDAGNIALVYEVVPTTAFGFGKGESFSQTCWCF